MDYFNADSFRIRSSSELFEGDALVQKQWITETVYYSWFEA